VEMCITIMVIAIMTVLYLPCVQAHDTEQYTFSNAYLERQSEAICEREHRELEDDSEIAFNAKGNVNRAATLTKGNRKIIIELGGGRLVFP
jgi:competence protein ComGC